jgi:hypothetical protein
MADSTILKSAPKDLVQLYEGRIVGKGFKYLKLLLTHLEMEPAWQELARHTNKDDHGERLFREIVYILHKIHREIFLRRSEEKEKFLATAKQAEKLSDDIENGPLDKLAFEYFPAEVMHINGISEWDMRDSMTRSNNAHSLLCHWPSFIEMLGEMASNARKRAEESMTRHRIIEKRVETYKYRELYFIRALAEFTRCEYGSPLYGTVAHITNAVLGTTLSKEDIAKKVLERNSTKT